MKEDGHNPRFDSILCQNESKIEHNVMLRNGLRDCHAVKLNFVPFVLVA